MCFRHSLKSNISNRVQQNKGRFVKRVFFSFWSLVGVLAQRSAPRPSDRGELHHQRRPLRVLWCLKPCEKSRGEVEACRRKNCFHGYVFQIWSICIYNIRNIYIYSCMYVFIDIDLYICHRQIHFHICAGVFTQGNILYKRLHWPVSAKQNLFRFPTAIFVAMFCNRVRDKMWLVNHMFSCADIPSPAITKANRFSLIFPRFLARGPHSHHYGNNSPGPERGNTETELQSQKWRQLQNTKHHKTNEIDESNKPKNQRVVHWARGVGFG